MLPTFALSALLSLPKHCRRVNKGFFNSRLKFSKNVLAFTEQGIAMLSPKKAR